MRTLLTVLSFVGLLAAGLAHAAPPKIPASPDAPIQITKAEAKQLDVSFKKALSVELRGLEHRLRSELRELRNSQSASLKEWEKRETEARRKFFAEHAKGSEKREYIQAFLARRKALLQSQKEALQLKTQQSDELLRTLKTDQAKRTSDFRNALSRGERPDSALWKTSAKI